MPNSDSSRETSLPSQSWMPSSNASICVYWDCIRSGTFSVALQLLDRSLVRPGESGIILYTTLSSPDRIQLPFSVRDEHSGATLLSGRFMLREDEHGIVQLWLEDARYPNGCTGQAQISGPAA